MKDKDIVLNMRNRNVIIEVVADILNDSYFIDENKGSISVFKRVNPKLLEFMVLLRTIQDMMPCNGFFV